MNPIFTTIYFFVRKAGRQAGKALTQASVDFRAVPRPNWFALMAAAITLATPALAAAQGSAAPPRVTDRVDTSRLVVLQGNTHPLARAQYDQGAAPADLPMDRILLVLKRSPEQEAALQDLLQQQQDTSSPNYHKWLTPDQFGQQFGPADADIQAVTSWLASYGFQSIQVSKGRTVIEFSGTASQVETALHTPIHRYLVNGESHWANANDPQIPAALAPVTAGIVSLHNFRKKPLFVRSGQQATATITPGEKPLVNFTNGHAIAPADFNVIYNVGSGMTGAGATIAVVSDTDISLQDVHTFRSMFGLPTNDPQTVLNGPDPGDLLGDAESEALLDVTWSGAVAPNATVKLVVSEDTNDSNGVDLSELYIIDYNLADVMTESILTCEAGYSSGSAAYYSFLAEQAAAQGITYLVASGDGGPDGCDDFSTVPAHDSAPSVNLLASTPYTIAVGGTQFNDTASPNTYWKTSSNGATSTESAISYIPENVWNESCTVTQCGSANAGLWSSGGGQSIFFPKPIWQAGVAGIPSANARFLPDVSLTAASHDGYVACLDGSCQGTGCPPGVNPCFAVFGGTSASVQAFGGVMALVVQKTGARQGQANYVLYRLAANETLASCNGSNTTALNNSTDNCIFNDTTSGNTNIPSGNGSGETGFSAGVGYDEATGLGSVNVANLVNQWGSLRINGSTTMLSLNNGTAVNIAHGTPVPVNITVAAKAPATGTPTGDVSLISNSTTWQGTDGFNLVSGSVSSSTIFLPGGTYTVTAHYEGDGTFTGSDSPPTSVTVSPESSLTAIGIVIPSGLCTTVSSVVYGSPYVLSGGVIDSAGSGTVCSPSPTGAIPSGTVTLTDGANPLDAGTFKLNSAGFFEDQPIQLPVGIHNIKAVYNGDSSFSSSTSTTDVVTVTQTSTTTSLGASQTAVSAGTNVTFTATVVTSSNATANTAQEPTGTVQFFVAGVASGAPVSVAGGINSNTGFAQAVATKSTTTLAAGQNVVTAQYLGDNNYAASPACTIPACSVTVTVGSAGINPPQPGCGGATVTIAAPGNSSGPCVITVTGANGFAGTITLSAPVTAGPSAFEAPACTFGTTGLNFTAPNTITLSAASETGNATMTCTSTAASRILFRPSPPPYGHSLPVAAAALSLICFFFLLGVPQQRRWSFAPLAVLVVVFILTAVGCGGSSSGGSGGNPGTTLGNYTVTVTAAPAGGIAQTTTVTVIVN